MNFKALTTKGNKFLVSRYQTADQIAAAIYKAIQESKPAADFLAAYFKAPTKKESLKQIFTFCKNYIPYKAESEQSQTAKTIGRILSDAKKDGGDCKHYATFCGALAKALNIPVNLRLISQKPYDTTPNHIYAVAFLNGKEVIIDPVLDKFDTEARYNYKYDIKIN